MKYFSDLEQAGKGQRLIEFVLSAINEYKASDMYSEAVTAYEYFKKRNVTISQYQKLLYTLSGEAVPDNYSANYKFCNAFFPIFVKQENAFLIGNGITFNSKSTKDKFGGDEFDKQLYTAGEFALWGSVAFVFFNRNKIKPFKVTEFVPLFDDETGALRAGIRFWQLDVDRPLRATLYEEDGYTEFIWRKDGEILNPKRTYIQIVKQSVADGEEIVDGSNYPSLPIVPLWANKEHQTELTGLREKIDGYDLIQSGFANDLDEASLLYWTINNAGGMDDIDLAQFRERMKTVKAAALPDEAQAEAHTIELPYQARQAGLADIRDSLYRDAMALDTDKISAGNVTATAINAAYENLELKCDGYEYCVTECIKGLLTLVGIDDSPTYHRRRNTNQPEITDMILSAAQYLDDETVLKYLPFLNIDEVQDILKKRDKEEQSRYKDIQQANVENDVETVENQE